MNIGDRIGDYEIVQVIGAGGMGQVYKVRNSLSERVEAMKVALPNLEGSQELVDRFLREIKVQAALDHPNIAKLHTAMRFGNQLLMFMEFVDGDSLSKLLESGALPIASAVNYSMQALDALGYAHAQGVVHRDIKPANIMVTANGVVKLMDFGIARAKADRKLTQTGSAVGSLFYMSPEQIRGGEPDPRSDLYSFGITLYELVTGQRPFGGNSDFQIMSAHLQETPAPPTDVVPNIPTDLSDIILMAISKDPEARFQSAQAFRGALSSVAVGSVAASAPPRPVRTEELPPTKTAAAAQQETRPLAATRPPVPSPSPAPLPAPSVWTAPSVPSKTGGRRGLYMALGSIATLAVLVAAVIEGPKLINGGSSGAQTQPATSIVPLNSVPLNNVPSNNAPLNSYTPPAASTPTPAPAPPASQPVPVASTPVVSPAARPSQTAQLPPRAPVATQQSAPAVQQAQPAVRTPVSQPVTSQSFNPQPAQQSQAPAPAPVQQPPAQARPAPPSPELAELRESYNLVSIRASTSKAGLSSMEQQMSRQGLNLRGDIREASTRMDYFLQESMASIRAGDVEAGKRNLQMAERALESIEKFLGR